LVRGSLDAIISTGYVEGWAFDDTALLKPLTVSVLESGRLLAQGIANLYRSDLVEAGHGTGWCAFRLKLSELPNDAGTRTLSLWDMSSRREICRNVPPWRVQDGEKNGLPTLEDVIFSDPTIVHSIEQLRGCNSAFATFIEAEGIDKFVHYAYVYMLGRPGSASAHLSDTMRLRTGSLTPYELLRNLCESEEFRSSPRLLMSPSEPSFVFHLDHQCDRAPQQHAANRRSQPG
jgi:hypothetical protein